MLGIGLISGGIEIGMGIGIISGGIGIDTGVEIAGVVGFREQILAGGGLGLGRQNNPGMQSSSVLHAASKPALQTLELVSCRHTNPGGQSFKLLQPLFDVEFWVRLVVTMATMIIIMIIISVTIIIVSGRNNPILEYCQKMHRSDFQKLLDIKKTQIEMIADRGYEITPDERDILPMNVDDFIDYINRLGQSAPKAVPRSLLSRSYLVKNEEGQTVRSMLVYYAGRTQTTQKQITVEVVRDFIRTVQKYGINEAILIVDAHLSSIGEYELSALTLTKWQVFFDDALTYNPTKHIDTPRHELIDPGHQQEKLRELKVDKSKLLILKESDPIARYYGWTAGNLVRIHRVDTVVSILAPKSTNYRIIVD